MFDVVLRAFLLSALSLEVFGIKGNSSILTKLTAFNPVPDANFGRSVCLSADGRHAVAGAPYWSKPDGGGAFIFMQGSGSEGWVQRQRLQCFHSGITFGCGSAVAISGDGNYALVSGRNSSGGVVYVFAFNGSEWAFQQLLPGNAHDRRIDFGRSLALSADGSVALIGGPIRILPGLRKGASYIYTRSGSSWSFQHAMSPPEDGDHTMYFGINVALDGLGHYALVGALDNQLTFERRPGAAYMYHFHGKTWEFQQQLLSTEANPYYGAAVALSSDGMYAIIGGIDVANTIHRAKSSVFVFSRSGNQWGRTSVLAQQARVTAAGFGGAISINAEGKIIVVSGYLRLTRYLGKDVVFTYTRNSTGWHQSGMLVDPESSSFGTSVALSGDGRVGLVGATSYNNNQGAVYMCSVPGGNLHPSPSPGSGADAGILGAYVVSAVAGAAVVGAIGYICKRRQGRRGVAYGRLGAPTQSAAEQAAPASSDGVVADVENSTGIEMT